MYDSRLLNPVAHASPAGRPYTQQRAALTRHHGAAHDGAALPRKAKGHGLHALVLHGVYGLETIVEMAGRREGVRWVVVLEWARGEEGGSGTHIVQASEHLRRQSTRIGSAASTYLGFGVHLQHANGRGDHGGQRGAINVGIENADLPGRHRSGTKRPEFECGTRQLTGQQPVHTQLAAGAA